MKALPSVADITEYAAAGNPAADKGSCVSKPKQRYQQSTDGCQLCNLIRVLLNGLGAMDMYTQLRAAVTLHSLSSTTVTVSMTQSLASMPGQAYVLSVNSCKVFTQACCNTTPQCSRSSWVAMLTNRPDKCSTSRSRTCSSSRTFCRCSRCPRPSFCTRTSSTFPLTARGMWSTYCGLMIACRSSSRIRVK